MGSKVALLMNFDRKNLQCEIALILKSLHGGSKVILPINVDWVNFQFSLLLPSEACGLSEGHNMGPAAETLLKAEGVRFNNIVILVLLIKFDRDNVEFELFWGLLKHLRAKAPQGWVRRPYYP